jgi:LPXTG-motif cell wall-anchored protein
MGMVATKGTINHLPNGDFIYTGTQWVPLSTLDTAATTATITSDRTAGLDITSNAIDLAKSYNAHVDANAQIIALFSQPNTLQALKDAISMVGMPPNSGCGGCDWDGSGYLNFYALVKYLKQYPLPTAKTKCSEIKAALLALDSEYTSIDKYRSLGNTNEAYNTAYYYAILQIKSAYNGWYTSNNCDLVIANEEKAAQNSQTQNDLKDNLNTLNTLTDPNTPTTASSNSIYYLIGGIVVVGVVIMLAKKKNKD